MASVAIYSTTTYIANNAPARAQEGKRRTPRAVAAREAAASRVRGCAAHRVAVARCAEIPRCVALPAPLSPREARVDRGTVGGEGESAAASLLPTHDRGQESPRGPALVVARVRQGDGCHRRRAAACLSGEGRFARGSRILSSIRQTRRRSSTRWRST